MVSGWKGSLGQARREGVARREADADRAVRHARSFVLQLLLQLGTRLTFWPGAAGDGGVSSQ